MSEFSNDLSPAQIERLALLLEEAGEVQQVIGKILRHGYESMHPNGRETNRELLTKELGDLWFAMDLVAAAGDVSGRLVTQAMNSKKERVWRYMHHNSKPKEGGNDG